MEEKLRCENVARLVGVVGAAPRPSHQTRGEWYDTFPLAVRRLSQAEDVPNVVVRRELLKECPLSPGMTLRVEGEVRSFNNRGGAAGNRLVITLFAKELTPVEEDTPHENAIHMAGTLCKPPIYRTTPLGKEICDLMLAVNRPYGRADYLPCIAWGRVARQCGECAVGSQLDLEGRLQSRGYTKTENGTTQVRTAFEISVMKINDVRP